MNKEQERLQRGKKGQSKWKKWGPYLSERQWGTVREDYSEDGIAWNYFTHDQARSRAYRWGEDGLAGISDDKQLLCFALAFWNGKDSIVKERLFGLNGFEGNHGEDVKEYYYYLDSTPTHSYMKYLYKYPQSAFPYEQLVETNIQRSKLDHEYELVDTGIFDEDRYFDIFVEYAKDDTEDILIKISVYNRGPEQADLRLLPSIWFRNTLWQEDDKDKPKLEKVNASNGAPYIKASHVELGEYHLYCQGSPDLLFCDNETNTQRIFDTNNVSPYVKDGINNYVTLGEVDAVNPNDKGTKAAADYALTIGVGESAEVRLRLAKRPVGTEIETLGASFDEIVQRRRVEADEFYKTIIPESLGAEEQSLMRQAFAGMLWTKQFYNYDLSKWLEEHKHTPKENLRNKDWSHMRNADILSMPDKWEYPWYAVWDTAFHTFPLVLVDPDFAKEQLTIFLEKNYMHPNGQIPAYEWNFSDVNPPVHAFAVMGVYKHEIEVNKTRGDINFLQKCFDSLRKNFNWWINHKDPTGQNVFQGGFLGLDNIGVFDRSVELPTGGHLEQSDGNAWMALYAQNMFEISLELARADKRYEQEVITYFDHFLTIASAMDRIGTHDDEMWDTEDGFFYDVLRFPDGHATRLKVRSLVGLLPMAATTVIEPDLLEALPGLNNKFIELRDRIEALSSNIACPKTPGLGGRYLLAVLNEKKLRSILKYMLDEEEFLSDFGIRSLSKFHEKHPYSFHWDGAEHQVKYVPGESDTLMFGGNSNWRGPIWMPANLVLLRALLHHYAYYGDSFRVECPTGSGNMMTLFQVALEIETRLKRIFLRNEQGHRPFNGGITKFQEDPLWSDHMLFYEYFHGDNGAGLGANHQTGWTGSIATILAIFGSTTSEMLLEEGFGVRLENILKQLTH